MIILPAILDSVRTRKDRTLSITFSTNEVTPAVAADIMFHNQAFCYLAIKKDDFKSGEKLILENMESTFEDKGKTPGQRLRSVLYLAWKQAPEGFTDFGAYYASKMEKVIEHFKSKLEPDA